MEQMLKDLGTETQKLTPLSQGYFNIHLTHSHDMKRLLASFPIIFLSDTFLFDVSDSFTMTNIDPEQLKIYYQKYFPSKQFQRWLHQNLSHREFSMTLSGSDGKDIYARFQSYNTIMDLKKDLTERTPIKIDIGAIYNIKPKERKTIDGSQFVPLRRELVFDIDMNDYDSIRTCCKETNICKLCWGFMTCAIQVIDTQLRFDFGFKNIMWVFSGRRGVHCWVCDDRAMKLSKEERAAIVNYMSYKGDALTGQKLHPSLEMALQPCSLLFSSILLDQMGILDTQVGWEKFLALLTDRNLQKELEALFPTLTSGRERWETLKKKAKEGVLKDIIYKCTYPRLDTHVSTGLNHLLKSPFSIHPSTGLPY
jgi:DNA primase small subunit